MNKSLTLMWHCKTPRGWRRFPVVTETKYKLERPIKGRVIDDGVAVDYPMGRFQIRRYEGNKPVFTPLTTEDPVAAYMELEKARRFQQRQNLQEKGQSDDTKVLAKAAINYINDCKRRKAMTAAHQAELVTQEFIPLVKTPYTISVTRNDILEFHESLRSRGCSERTIYNRHLRLKSFLKFCGVDVKKLFPPTPKYEKKLPTIYTRDEVKRLLNTPDKYLRLVIDLGLKLGLREQEITYAEWDDIHWSVSVFRVQSKLHWEFKVKDSEQRDIPIPSDLLETLKVTKKTSASRLIVPTSKGKPNGKLLLRLKNYVRKIGLNCGKCDGCKGPNNECNKWTLHKLRRTYCTTLLRNSVDLKTVQHYMGHADLESTLRYLRPAETAESQAKINSIKWG